MGIGADDISIFNRVSERAAQYAEERSAELVTQIDEATRNDIANIIAQGLKENIGTEKIAQRLEEAYAFGEERSFLIARTEIGFANNNGVLEGMFAAQEAGVAIFKGWLPDAEACDVCVENGKAGLVPLEDAFPSGDMAPLAHPRCECNLYSEIQE